MRVASPMLVEFAEAIVALDKRAVDAEDQREVLRQRYVLAMEDARGFMDQRDAAVRLLAKIVRDSLCVFETHLVVFDGTILDVTAEEHAEIARLAAREANAL